MYKKIWSTCLNQLENKITKATVDSWFRQVELDNMDNEKVYLTVKNQFIADWIQEHYYTIIQQTLAQITGKNLKLIFKGEDIPKEKFPVVQEKMNFFEPPVNEITMQSQLNNRYTFTNFVVGDCNQFAFAASQKVADFLYYAAYNPLVIYGSSGLGKTHLLQSIGNYCLLKNSNLNICYLSSKAFMNFFINAVQQQSILDFNRYFNNIDLLLIDDIHFLSGKEGTQVEFFHTFNHLHEAGKQIVLTSDRAPNEIKDINDRLITRFQWGLVVDIQPPDLETRIAILKKKLENHNFNLDEDTLYYLANQFKNNIRELEGIITRLSAFYSLSDLPITLDLCKEVLKDLIPRKNEKYSIEMIQKIVSSFFNINQNNLLDRGRKTNIAVPRMIAMYLSRELSRETLITIGMKFGRRDHSTVLNACDRIAKMMNESNDFKKQIEHIIHLIEINQ